MKERPLQRQIIYGPIASRRLGRSLGVNILPVARKVCSFDCLYCQYGWTGCDPEALEREARALPTVAEVAAAVREALPAAGELDSLTLAGNGEPSLHPRFAELVAAVRAVRDELRPGLPLAILSNSSTILDPACRAGFLLLDRRIMKLDAGREETFRRVNRPPRGVSLEQVTAALAELRPLELQSLFFAGEGANSDPEEVEAWAQRLARIAPSAVQVYSLDRAPADSRLLPLGRTGLEAIAARARLALPAARVEVFV